MLLPPLIDPTIEGSTCLFGRHGLCILNLSDRVVVDRRPAKLLSRMIGTPTSGRRGSAGAILAAHERPRPRRSVLTELAAGLATEQFFGLAQSHEFPEIAELVQVAANLNPDRLTDPADIDQ
jgi:hypothetical protein